MKWEHNVYAVTKLFKLPILIVYVCCFLCSGVNSAYSDDLSPPTISAYDFSPKSVDVTNSSAMITITGSSTDPSGVSDIRITIRSPNWIYYYGHATPDASGNFNLTVTIPKGASSGQYVVYSIGTRDTVNNEKIYWDTELSALGFPTTLQVISGIATYIITSSVSGTGGGINCSPTTVAQGQSSDCSIVPANGYKLSTLTDNGNSVTSTGGSYSIGSVSSNHAIIATFRLVDTTAPAVSLSLPTTSASLTVPVRFSATDNIGVNLYCLVATDASGDCSWVLEAPSSYTFPSTGVKTLYAFAKDDANNISSVSSASVTIDAALPSLSVSTLLDGATTKNSTINITGTVIDATGLQSLTVNGQTVVVGSDSAFSTAVTLNEGVNNVVTIASNIAGKQAIDSRSITLDTTAPNLAVTTPADNSITNKSSATITGTVSENSNVIASVFESSAMQSGLLNGNKYELTINLIPGINTITVTASDIAGNVSQVKRSIISDVQVPELAITSPSQDVRINATTYLLKGTVNDSITPITLTLSFEGQSFNPVVTNGAFEQLLTFTTLKQYPVTIVATDQAGNSATVQRNFIYSASFDYPIYNGNATLSCNVPVSPSFSTTCNTINNAYNCQLSVGLSSSSEQLAACRIVPAIGSSFTNATGCSGAYSGNDFVSGALGTECTISGKLSGTIASFTITGTVLDHNGMISCSSPVYAGDTSTCTILLSDGYGIASATGCGGILQGTTFTTAPITTNCSVNVEAIARNATSTGYPKPTVRDAIKVIRSVVGISLLSDADKIRYDVSPLGISGKPMGNGIIDLTDAMLILRKSLGLQSW